MVKIPYVLECFVALFILLDVSCLEHHALRRVGVPFRFDVSQR